jgi:uncharacterized protein involved in exopolysaccharide biosynthesis
MSCAPATPLIDPQLTGWLRDRAQSVVRRRWIAIWVFLSIVTIVTVALLICPRTYMSQARLFVRLGRESVSLDPTATTGATIAVSDTREHEINSVMEMINNQAVLADVVRALGADTVLGRRPVPPRDELAQRLATALGNDSADLLSSQQPTLAEEKALKRLQKIITSDLPKKSSVINLTCKADSPELAQAILDVFLTAFRTHHVRANRADGSLPFFEEQAQVLKQELESATAELVSAKNDVGVISLDERSRGIEGELARIRTQLHETRAEQAAVEATRLDLQSKQERLPQWQIAQEVQGQPDDAVGATRRTLYDLQIKERELLSRYTQFHPLVVATRRQIDQAERLLSTDAPLPLAQTMRTPDPGRQQVQLQLLEQESNVEALRGKAAQLAQQLDELNADRNQLNREEGRIRRLQQQVDVLQASYGEYLSKREQARVGQALGHEKISNVNVIQPASYVSEAVAPQRKVIFLLGAFVAAVGAILAAMIGDSFGTTDAVEHFQVGAATQIPNRTVP